MNLDSIFLFHADRNDYVILLAWFSDYSQIVKHYQDIFKQLEEKKRAVLYIQVISTDNAVEPFTLILLKPCIQHVKVTVTVSLSRL